MSGTGSRCSWIAIRTWFRAPMTRVVLGSNGPRAGCAAWCAGGCTVAEDVVVGGAVAGGALCLRALARLPPRLRPCCCPGWHGCPASASPRRVAAVVARATVRVRAVVPARRLRPSLRKTEQAALFAVCAFFPTVGARRRVLQGTRAVPGWVTSPTSHTGNGPVAVVGRSAGTAGIDGIARAPSCRAMPQ
ncbi:jg19749 [Pararge aegeria aegeria]|uniref:Jg19749 protein n=1 Tax=Pararge aegeria aegeria TaxID=348720 RepID=A0A8S4QYT4_9NEOP|nr:jg19749 [Pararge aegeria aegeria]